MSFSRRLHKIDKRSSLVALITLNYWSWEIALLWYLILNWSLECSWSWWFTC